MDKKLIRNYQIFSAFFTFILGTLLHFTYKLSGENRFVAIFSAVNESVWEHLKLLFFPMLITTIIGYIFFYTYTGIIGKNIAIIDISSFFIATILGEFLSYLLIINSFECNSKTAVIVLFVLFICFVIFTYFPPKLGIFKDPITGEYGIS